jgi:hypothetical protein
MDTTTDAWSWITSWVGRARQTRLARHTNSSGHGDHIITSFVKRWAWVLRRFARKTHVYYISSRDQLGSPSRTSAWNHDVARESQMFVSRRNMVRVPDFGNLQLRWNFLSFREEATRNSGGGTRLTCGVRRVILTVECFRELEINRRPGLRDIDRWVQPGLNLRTPFRSNNSDGPWMARRGKGGFAKSKSVQPRRQSDKVGHGSFGVPTVPSFLAYSPWLLFRDFVRVIFENVSRIKSSCRWSHWVGPLSHSDSTSKKSSTGDVWGSTIHFFIGGKACSWKGTLTI